MTEGNETTRIETEDQNVSTLSTLIAHFDDMRMLPDRKPAVGDFGPVLDSESFREHSFKQSKDGFLSVIDKEKVKRYLSAEESTQEAFAYLKKIRRFGQMLRGNYRFSDSSHAVPEKLHHFLRLLGDYNDRYWLPEKQDVSQLRAALEYIDGKELVLNGVSNQNFEEYVRKTLDVIKTLLKEPELPAKEFHELRKQVHLFADFLAVAASENYRGDIHWLFSSVSSLSRELGEQHDDLVRRDLRKEIDYQNAVVQVNPNIRQEFEKLEPYIEKVTGIQ